MTQDNLLNPMAPPPLAARMRPRSIDEMVGQEHVLGEGKMLRTLIERDEIRSVILWGPAGTGKTTIAHIVADRTSLPVEKLSAISSGVADVRKVIDKARKQGRTVLFLDEIHRFNKAQQDAFLGAVEDGVIVLIGATTENPFFEVNSPLLSRSLLLRLEPLTAANVRSLLVRALSDDRGIKDVKADDDGLDWIAEKTGGDARVAYNALESAASTALARDGRITLPDAQEALERRVVRWDREGDRHYDVISAFIKSMRASDPDAALFWLAEMLEAGEDPKFICRRMIIAASEDIGTADSNALVVAVAAAHALANVGLPEASINMAHAAVYLATAPKSHAVYHARNAAFEDVRERTREVPKHLKQSQFVERALGERVKWVNEFRPPELEGRRYYDPNDPRPKM